MEDNTADASSIAANTDAVNVVAGGHRKGCARVALRQASLGDVRPVVADDAREV